jgi:predicted metal-binding membrane protein
MTTQTLVVNNFEPGVVIGSRRAFFAAFTMLFAVCAAATTAWCHSMAAMGEMPMPGGWTMSMMWMRMPGQTWTGATTAFTGMWVVMMAAMMLPSLAPVLWSYRQSLGRTSEMLRVSLTALAGLSYFAVWSVFGLAVFPLGVAMATVEMGHPLLSRAAPVAAGVVVLIAGAVQLTSWKAQHLARCRKMPAAGASTAWQDGVRLGLHCCFSCVNLTAILLVIGAMNLAAMALVTAAITAERLAPAGGRVAQAIGVVVILTGLFLVTRAI